MKLIRHALVAGFAVAAVSAAACSSQHGATGSGSAGNGQVGINGGSTGDEGTGQVGMHLTLAPGVSLTSVTWTINGGAMPYTGTDQIGDAESLEFVAGGIPAGGPYTVTITGTDSNGDSCSGMSSLPFSITAGAVTQTSLTVVCTTPGTTTVVGAQVDSGSVEVDAGVVFQTGDGGTFSCPGITGVSVSPAEINLAGSAGIIVTTIGPASTVSYTVSPAGGGTFTPVSGATSSFKCSGTAAQVAISATVTATDSATATACVGKPFETVGTTTSPILINCEFGTTTTPDAGTTTPDSGTTTTPDSGTTTPDAGTTASCVPVCDPAKDPTICTNGLTNGAGGASCNATEQLYFNHDQGTSTAGDCLKCALNFGCLDDAQGDVGPDCEDVSGTVPAGSVGAGTSLQTDCTALLSCELTSKCGAGNVLDCYCGVGVGSTTCKTTQTGACIPQVQNGLESSDPNFIQANFTATANNNGGSRADKTLACAQRNCLQYCF